VSRFEHLVRTQTFDVLIVLLALAATVEISASHGSPTAVHVALWFAILAIAVLAVLLFFRRRFPFGAPAAFWLLAAGLSLLDGRLVTVPRGVFFLGIAAAYLLGNVSDAVKARLGLAVVVGSAALIVYQDPEASNGEFVFVPLLFGVSWLAGFVLRERERQAEAAEERAARAEREREAAARLAVAEERARIARELHDIVAHAVSVMVLQVGAVRHKLPDAQAEDRDALRGVEQAGRTALAEMRRLLAAMRREGDEAELVPQPGLDRLDSLLDEVGRAGLPVELHVEGEPFALPRGIDLSAYRIVQEGLTNALKHAQANTADVTLRYQQDELGIEVRDDGLGTSTTDGLGHGLVGVRERVKIYGGDMSAGTADGNGFVLRTRLPIVDRES
jgi:signal transduction histidine kinase